MARVSWWSFAWRNLLKNPRRTAFTIVAIALGYSAITIFGGFTSYVFTSLREAQIYAQADGHLMVFKKVLFWDSKTSAQERHIDQADLATLRALFEKDPEVEVITTQLAFRGLLSNGEVSTIFMGVGKVWSDVEKIRSLAEGIVPRLRLFEGDPIRDQDTPGIGIGRGLSKLSRLPLGSEGIAVSPTLEGQINALDARVVQITDAPSDWLENVIVVAPLTFAQGLLDTDWVDRVTLLLRRASDVEGARRRIRSMVEGSGLQGYDVITWREMSPMYVKTERMFNIIFLFVFAIILLISVLIVVNTTSMAITERTREIGTLRALGVKRRGIIAIFARESVLLGLVGSAIGASLTVACRAFILSIDLSWTPPTLNRDIPFLLEIVPVHLLLALAGMIFISLVAALLPARRASRMDIVDALGHV